MALIPLFLLALASRGGGGRGNDDFTPLPPDHGYICFGEGTLIWLERGWVPVEEIQTGDRIVTSRGIQTILTVESWQPVEYRDRPAVFENVRLSPNHGIKVGNIIVPACNLTTVRSRIDGSRYFHILVEDHSWLFAKADADGTIIRAESLCMTADLKLAKTFPDLVARHASDPVAQIRVDPKDPTARRAA
ncbi:Hint domain-containing protein [uncultured Paracoccus sp.]|uniref:Hint domain-containing protein n=1 Tax=uncultured Paracoccus sp. TaxID=189685 RepID=UPI0026153BEB|nr:Hint domain-containing protein [uncultured Paracoccus sp.]